MVSPRRRSKRSSCTEPSTAGRPQPEPPSPSPSVSSPNATRARRRGTKANEVRPTRIACKCGVQGVVCLLPRHVERNGKRMRTQVGIVGGGPAGTLLSHLLHLQGIESVVLELRGREEVETTVRAGVLEDATAELLRETGVGERMDREGAVHEGIELRFGGLGRRIDFADMTGKSIVIYGQQEVVKDLYAARLEAGGEIVFEAAALGVEDLDTTRPKISFRRGARLDPEAGGIRFDTNTREEELACDYVVGADGFFGPCRNAIPD